MALSARISEIPASDPTPIPFSIRRGDGDSLLWPTETESCKVLPLDHPSAIRWRTAIGTALAQASQSYVNGYHILSDWPSGYQLFTCARKTPGCFHADLYLYGVPNRRSRCYRSPKEFIPHALWLHFDSTEDRQNCNCLYCSPYIQKQKKLSKVYSPMPVSSCSRNVLSSPRVIIICQSRVAILSAHTPGVSLKEGDLAWVFLKHAITAPNNHRTLHVWPAMLVSPPDSSSWVDIRLIQVGGKHRVPLTALLPYNAVSTSETLLNIGLSNDTADFMNPPILGAEELLGQAEISWERAVKPFAYAVSITASLKTFWSPISDDPFAAGNSLITGVWWGAERLAAGDFVRLNVGKHDIFLSGSAAHSEAVFAASDNGACAVFLRISRIVMQGTGPVELLFVGMLYELCNEGVGECDLDDIVEVDISDVGSSNQHSQAETNTSDDFVDVEIPAASNTHQSEAVEIVLPDAPIGYAFRPMITDGLEALIPAALIHGRYHPRAMEHPRLSGVPLEALSTLAELEGLLCPSSTHPPSIYVFGRTRMLEKAEWIAQKSLAEK